MRYRNTPSLKNGRRIGGWLPNDPRIIRDYVRRTVKEAREAASPTMDLIEPVRNLRHLIQTSPIVNMLFTEMLREVPPGYDQDPTGEPEIRDVDTLLVTLDFIATSALPYNDSFFLGFPINAILLWPMATTAGFAAFLRDDVNECIRQILQYWGHFLTTPESLKFVNTDPGNWLSVEAQTDSASPGLANFLQTYIVPDPNDRSYGFKSWDDFFTRRFLPGVRPLDSGDSSVIVSPAEAIPFMIQENVKPRDSFWAKDQAYALDFLLGDPAMASQFCGGTVYQAFLGADRYHNWNAPVSGQYIRPPGVVAGTYYSEPLLCGFSPDVEDRLDPDPDGEAQNRSQGYLSCVAKRGVAFIQPDDPSLGLIALVMIGMAEASSVEFDQLPLTPTSPQGHFNKGDEIGRFHFGGSSFCMVFQPHVKFIPIPEARILDATHKTLNTKIIQVRSKVGTLESAKT